MFWMKIHHLDSRGRALADRHYSRQTIGAREWLRPGNKIALLSKDGKALWASYRSAPTAGISSPDGFEYWNNPLFRNEGAQGILASELILQALAVTLFIWGKDSIPSDGFHTFIDPKKVKPTIRRGEKIYGYCFLKAGFEEYPARTKSRNLIRFIMTREQLLAIEPIEPFYEQMKLAI